VDTYASIRKQFLLLRLVMSFYREAGEALEAGADINEVIKSPVRERLAAAKFIREENLEEFDRLERVVAKAMEDLAASGVEAEKESGRAAAVSAAAEE